MKALFIGGTGTISTEISRLCVKQGWELTLLNRGNNAERVPEGARVIHADINNEAQVADALVDESFDVVADFIAFTPDQAERDIRLFSGKTAQYFFISTASAYQKPERSAIITESTPLCNPYWQYSRSKIDCENVFMRAYRENGFPVTIIRPAHTYCERSIPTAIHGPHGSFHILERIRTGRKVIILGDGSTFWTLTHSRDFAVGFVGLMGNSHAIGESYHIVSDEALTWDRIYECIGNALGVTPKIVHIASDTIAAAFPGNIGAMLGDKTNVSLFDNSKIKRAVPEFATHVRFDQGAREAVEYIYSHKECRKRDDEFDAWMDAVIEKCEKMTEDLPRFE